MNRRKAIAAIGGAVSAFPVRGWAQQTGRLPRVGVLSPGSPPPDDPFRQAERFEAGLVELGWKPGTSVVIDYRYARGQLAKLPTLAAELVGIPVDVIIARGQTVAAASAATRTIGIVMAADPNPVGNGFIKSLARPGGNVTGLTTQAFELEAKQLDLLKQTVPTLKRVALLTTATSMDANDAQMQRREAAAKALQIELVVQSLNSSGQLVAAFASMKEAGVGAVLISGTLWFVDARNVAALALTHHLPTIHNLREFAEAGTLMSYGVNFAELHRRSAAYVDKILKGANPADMPVEQPTKFDLVINMKTAAQLGLTFPPAIVVGADEVIE